MYTIMDYTGLKSTVPVRRDEVPDVHGTGDGDGTPRGLGTIQSLQHATGGHAHAHCWGFPFHHGLHPLQKNTVFTPLL